MRYFDNYRTNTDKEADPSTRIAQGDFPMRVRSIETRSDVMEPDLNLEGSIAEGTSFERDLYYSPSIDA